MLRRETERARQTEREMQQTLRARSNSNSQPRPASYHEAPVQLPQPVPHPHPTLLDQHDAFGSVSRRYGPGANSTRQDSWGRQGAAGYNDQQYADTNRSPVVSAQNYPYRSPHASKSVNAAGSRKIGGPRGSNSGNTRSGMVMSRKQPARRFGGGQNGADESQNHNDTQINNLVSN